MSRFIAFLRAINVANRRVKMDDLRRHFEAMGFSSVETFIASGNVLFDSDGADSHALEQLIEQKLRQSLGYEVATFVRSAAELIALAQYQPFGPDELSGAEALNVAFLSEMPGFASEQKLMALRTDIDNFHVHGREVYWLCRKKQSESTFSNVVLEKTLGKPATLRGFATLQRLAEKL